MLSLESLHWESLMGAWQTYDQYGYALLAVVGTFAAVYLIHRALQHQPWNAALLSLRGVAPPFINIIGVLFGLTLAFLANDTWSAHDRAMNAVYREADSLRTIAALSGMLEEPMQAQLRTSFANYARAIVDEWPTLAERQTSRSVSLEEDALLALLASPAMAKVAGTNLQALMLQKAIELRDLRDQRIALSQTHVNPLKWLGMAFLGLLTLLSVAVIHVDQPRAAIVAVLLFALAAAPTAAIVLVQGNPFQTPTSVTPAPIETVLAEL